MVVKKKAAKKTGKKRASKEKKTHKLRMERPGFKK
jgi:hypothetical protein